MQHEYQYTGKAMGTDFSIALVCDSKKIADTIAQQTIKKIHAYEAQFSRFDAQSELSQLNRQKDMVVSPTFLQVIQEARRLFVATQGVYNPLFQIERLGYSRSFETLTQDAVDVHEESYNTDFKRMGIDQQTRRITLHEGQKLDFGGFLKGYLATKLCREIKNNTPLLTGVIVNIGGDLHTEGMDAKGQAFVFEVYSPVTNTEIPLTLTNKSLATSGTYKRRWKQGDQEVHHILDASGTKNPDTGIVSASVIHKEGGDADAYAKVFLSVGIEKACTILNNTDLSYIIITNNGDVETNIL